VHEQLVVALGREPSRQELADALGVAVTELGAMEDDVQRAVVMSYQAMIETSSVEQALPASGPTPEDLLLDREQLAYLHDAVSLLPERLRQVVVGYFFEERQMQDIADEMGVTCSRVSQMRAEALLLLREAMQAHAEPEALAAAEPPTGRAARRKAAYVAAVGTHSDYRARLSVPLQRSPRAAAV
jgi:RNA polymerase sigma factor for flagellar operon FliA